MRRKLDQSLRGLTGPPPGVTPIDFTSPPGAPALFAPDSVTWRVMKNPVALMIGGIAAVIMELAEPRVRTGVWDFTHFKDDPVGRIRRTGYAALVTAFAPADAARAMIAHINRMHAAIHGHTPDGATFRADDLELLNWVHATASFGFSEAYHRFVKPLASQERDAFFLEGATGAALYGATSAPRSLAEWETMLEAMRPKLEASPIIFQFIDIMRTAPLLPGFARPLQGLVLRGAISLLPQWARDRLQIKSNWDLPLGGETALRALGGLADNIALESAPPAQAAKRMAAPAEIKHNDAPGS